MNGLKIQHQPGVFHQNKLNKESIRTVISWLLILMFLYAAMNKLMEYDKFKAQMGQSPMLTPYVDVLAWLVPSLEIVIAVVLVFPESRFLGFVFSLGLMVMFSAYIAIILNYNDYIPCSCGGILEKMSWKAHLLFNMFFVFLAGVGIILQAGVVNRKVKK